MGGRHQDPETDPGCAWCRYVTPRRCGTQSKESASFIECNACHLLYVVQAGADRKEATVLAEKEVTRPHKRQRAEADIIEGGGGKINMRVGVGTCNPGLTTWGSGLCVCVCVNQVVPAWRRTHRGPSLCP